MLPQYRVELVCRRKAPKQNASDTAIISCFKSYLNKKVSSFSKNSKGKRHGDSYFLALK